MDRIDLPLRVAVGRRLAGKLRERGITYEQLGRECGWSTSSISRRIRGETPLSVEDLECIQRVTGITPTELLVGEAVRINPFRQTGTGSSKANTRMPADSPTPSSNGNTPSSDDDFRKCATGRSMSSNNHAKSGARRTSAVATRGSNLNYPVTNLPLPWLVSIQQPFGLRLAILPVPSSLRSLRSLGRSTHNAGMGNR